MKAYQIFQTIRPELGRHLFQDLRDNHRDVYKSVLSSLASKRRLRPVFIQRKPASKQIDWLVKTCGLKPVNDVAEHMLQVWLLRSQKDMLIQFLDILGVEHDDDGTVEDLPDELDDEKLKTAIDSLLADHPRENVALYLHVFQLQQPGGWDNLQELLETDKRLALGEPTGGKDEAKSAGPSPQAGEEASPEDEEEASASSSKAAKPDSAEAIR